jgi:hypothetical protein
MRIIKAASIDSKLFNLNHVLSTFKILYIDIIKKANTTLCLIKRHLSFKAYTSS